jgi:hypothetical protein
MPSANIGDIQVPIFVSSGTGRGAASRGIFRARIIAGKRFIGTDRSVRRL